MTGPEATCPICRRKAPPPTAPDGGRTTFPFCSLRCADVDLGRWFTEQYRVPADVDMDEDHGGDQGDDGRGDDGRGHDGSARRPPGTPGRQGSARDPDRGRDG